MKIRLLEESDAVALASMIAEFEEFLWAIYGRKVKISCKARERAFRRSRLGRDSKIEGLIAEWNGKPCGYVLFNMSYDTGEMRQTLCIPDLYVRKGYRRKGVGEKLMMRLREIARERKCSTVTWTVWDQNPAALAFYLGLGAKPKSDEIVLQWKVQPKRKASGRRSPAKLSSRASRA